MIDRLMKYKIGDIVNLKITEKFNILKATGSMTIPFNELDMYIEPNLFKPYVTVRILKATYDDYADNVLSNDDDDDTMGLLETSIVPRNYIRPSKWNLCCWKTSNTYIKLNYIGVECKKCVRKIFIVPYNENMYNTWRHGSTELDAATAFDDYFMKVKKECNENNSKMHNIFNKDHFAVVSDCYVEVTDKKYMMLRHSNVICAGSYYEVLDKVNASN